MTAITLPSAPRPVEPVDFELMDWGALTNPAVGGSIQPIGRLGSRYQLTVPLPNMDIENARAWVAARLKSKSQGLTVTWKVPQPEGFSAAGLSGALVAGAGQAGTTLNIDGLAAGTVVKPLTALSFVMGGRHYLHMVDTEVTADGSGAAALSLSPAMRASPTDNLAVEMVDPVIEGFFREDSVKWTVERLCDVAVSFVLFENE